MGVLSGSSEVMISARYAPKDGWNEFGYRFEAILISITIDNHFQYRRCSDFRELKLDIYAGNFLGICW